MEHLLSTLRSIGLSTEFEVSFFSDEPKYPSYYCSPSPSCRYRTGPPYGLSIAATTAEAQAKSLAEFYERVCLLSAGQDAELAPWDPASGWIDPATLSQDRSPQTVQQLQQCQYVWLDAVDVQTSRATKIPAQSVVPNFGEQEERIIDAVGSTGAALGSAGDTGARDRGLFEVIERHALAPLTFEERLARRLSELPEAVHGIEATLRRYGLEPSVFLLPAKYETPCVLVVLGDHSGVGPALSLATRAAPTYAEAIYTGLFEALERRRPARIEEMSRSPESDAPRIYPWEPIEALREAEPLIADAEPVPFSALPSTPCTAESLLDRFAADDLAVYSVGLTVPEVAAAGFEATKIVIPGLGPMPA